MNAKIIAAVLAALLVGGGLLYVYDDGRGTGTVSATADYAAIVCDPSMGSVVPVSFEYPDAVYRAVPADGYVFVRWTDADGTQLSADAELTVDLTARTTVTAVFAASSLTQSYTYDFPVTFSSDAVATVQRTLTLTLSSTGYAASMAADTVRHAETDVRTPAYMVDPTDAGVKAVAAALTAATDGYSDLERLTAVLYWVQTAIPYAYDSVLYGQAEWWAYPSECLYNMAGDCEDTAVLFCSIAEAMGFQVALVAFDGHMGTAVVVDGVTGGQTYTADDATYTYCETAVDSAVGVGIISSQLASAACTVVPITGGSS